MVVVHFESSVNEEIQSLLHQGAPRVLRSFSSSLAGKLLAILT